MKANDHAWLCGAEDKELYCPSCMKIVKKHPSISHCPDCGTQYETEIPEWWRKMKESLESDSKRMDE